MLALELEAAARPHELAHLAPDLRPRLVRVLPFPAEGPAIVFIHGVGGDPGNQWLLIRAAQDRGMRVHTMLYETWQRGVADNAAGFAAVLRDLVAAGDDDVTLVAHSLGALTAKGALDRLRRPDGHLEGFRRLRFVALSAPWAGVTAANLATHLLTDVKALAFARDLAPGSAYWRGIMATPLAPEVELHSMMGTWDPYRVLTWHAAGFAGRDALLGQARRVADLPGGTHNATNWDARSIRWALDPETAPDPATSPSPPAWRTVLREAAATLGLPWAFREP